MTSPARAVEATGPRGLPRVGHVRAFLRDKLGFLSAAAHAYGDVVRLEIGSRTYLLANPADIGHVLVAKADNYVKSSRIAGRRARRFFGDGLVTLTGRAHVRQRRALQPLFHHRTIEGLAALMVRHAEAMLDRWSDGAPVDVHAEMLTLTQRIIVEALLGAVPEAEATRFGRAVGLRRRYQEHLLGSTFPFPEYTPSPINRAHRRASREIDAVLHRAIRAARERGDTPADDLLSMLVRARYEDGSRMGDPQICDEARTLAVGGYETLAEALTWAWYLLATSPDAASTLEAEVDRVLGGRAPTTSDLPRLPYARMVLAEAMRLYPPTWIVVRVAREADVLPSGVAIPARAKIYLCQWVMHRHARYFPDPDRFDPLRFAEGAAPSRPRFAYFPFGGGRRLCIGEEFAWMEGVLLLAAIAGRFRLSLVPGQVIAPDPNVTLRPRHGVIVRPTRR